MSDFTFKLEKNGNSHEILTPEGHIPIINTNGSAKQGCMIKVEDGKLTVKKLVLQHASYSNRILLKGVKEIGIGDGGTTAHTVVEVDFREKHGLNDKKITYSIDNTWVSFHIERVKQGSDEVDYLVVNSKPEM